MRKTIKKTKPTEPTNGKKFQGFKIQTPNKGSKLLQSTAQGFAHTTEPVTSTVMLVDTEDGDNILAEESVKRENNKEELVIPAKDNTNWMEQVKKEPKDITYGLQVMSTKNTEKQKPAMLSSKQQVSEDTDVDEHTYERVAVEDFGAAMLRGMGWKGDTAADELSYKPRPSLLGLGAQPRPTSAPPTHKIKKF